MEWLEEVKERIIEFLAVQNRVKQVKGPVLCLVGPPGVGKTSLGESIARVLSQNLPLPQEFVATKDTFGESGTPAELMEKYGLNANSIVEKAKKLISRK